MTRISKALLVDRIGFERVIAYDGGYAIRWGGKRGSIIEFEMTGETRLEDGTPAYVFEERHERPAAPPLPKVVERPPSVEKVARALFETDERVQIFATQKAESLLQNHLATLAQVVIASGMPRSADYKARYRRVLDIAWERNENSWRSDAEERAPDLLRVMSGGRVIADGAPRSPQDRDP